MSMRVNGFISNISKRISKRVAFVLACALVVTSFAGVPGFVGVTDTASAKADDIDGAAMKVRFDDPTYTKDSPVVKAKADQLFEDIKECYSKRIDTDEFRTKFNEVSKRFVYYKIAKESKDKKFDLTKIKTSNNESINLIKMAYGGAGNYFPAEEFTPEEMDEYEQDQYVLDNLTSQQTDLVQQYTNEFSQFLIMMKYACLASKKIIELQKTVFSNETFYDFQRKLFGEYNPKTDDQRGISNDNSSGFLDMYYTQYVRLAGLDHFSDCLNNDEDVSDNDKLKLYIVNNNLNTSTNVNVPGGYVSQKVNRFKDAPEGVVAEDTGNTLVITSIIDGKEQELRVLDGIEYNIEFDENAKNLITDVYELLLRKFNIEKKYKDTRASVDYLISQYGLTSEVRKIIQEFIDYADENGGRTVYANLYNHTEIEKFVDDYIAVKSFLDKLYSITKMQPETQKEISFAMEVYSNYNSLTDDQKELVTREDKAKLDERCGVQTTVDAVKKAIATAKKAMDDLKDGKDAVYTKFADAVITASNSYNNLVKAYPKAEVEDMITRENLAILNNASAVKEFLDRVRIILLDTKDEDMCDRYRYSIVPIYNDYQTIDSSLKPYIYNWDGFTVVYNDCKAAFELRERMDKLSAANITDDEKELMSIKTAYDAMNPKAKSYFGTTYETTLNELLKQLKEINEIHAKRVIDLINKIGVVTVESGRLIVDAEQAYSVLTENEKKLVDEVNYQVLVNARAQYNNLRADISFVRITGVKKSYVYARSSIKPVPVVTLDGVTLKKGVDYKLEYSSDVKNVGKAYVTVVAVDGGKYIGSKSKSFSIVKDSISDGTVSGVKSKYKYTGKKIKPTVKLKVNGYTLKKGTDYTVSYSSNKKKGTAKITIKGKGNYKGTKTKKFKIV